MFYTRRKKTSLVKRRRVSFARQFHGLAKIFVPSPSGCRPTSQVHGSSRRQSPSPHPKRTPVEEQPEELESATGGDAQDDPSSTVSPESNGTSMWGAHISYLDNSRPRSRPSSRDVQARREVEVIVAPLASAALSQSAITVQTRKSCTFSEVGTRWTLTYFSLL